MQTEKHCDRKDEWKWTHVLRHASLVGGLIYFPCLRPNLGRSRLRWFPGPPLSVVHERVHGFLNGRRNLLAPTAATMLGDIRDLALYIDPSMRHEVVPDPCREFSYADANDQFSELKVHLQQRPAIDRDVIFLDPDKGVRDGRSYAKEVGLMHVQYIWPEVRSGDRLLIYHSVPRKKNWISDLKTLVRTRLTPVPTVLLKANSAAIVIITK